MKEYKYQVISYIALGAILGSLVGIIPFFRLLVIAIALGILVGLLNMFIIGVLKNNSERK